MEEHVGLVRMSLFVEWNFTIGSAGVPEPGQMGGSRAAHACGMLMCLRFGHARYTQDSRYARTCARVSYPVAQAFVGSNPTPRTNTTPPFALSLDRSCAIKASSRFGFLSVV